MISLITWHRYCAGTPETTWPDDHCVRIAYGKVSEDSADNICRLLQCCRTGRCVNESTANSNILYNWLIRQHSDTGNSVFSDYVKMRRRFDLKCQRSLLLECPRGQVVAYRMIGTNLLLKPEGLIHVATRLSQLTRLIWGLNTSHQTGKLISEEQCVRASHMMNWK